MLELLFSVSLVIFSSMSASLLADINKCITHFQTGKKEKLINITFPFSLQTQQIIKSRTTFFSLLLFRCRRYHRYRIRSLRLLHGCRCALQKCGNFHFQFFPFFLFHLHFFHCIKFRLSTLYVSSMAQLVR